MNIAVENIKLLVQQEIDKIEDPIVKNSLIEVLVEPTSHLRKWDYSLNNESFECWTIAIDKSSDTSFIYSEYGFGPKNPWGLVSTSADYYGMDFSWFNSLVECFLDSSIAAKLPIWVVEKRNDSLTEIVGENLTTDEAFELIASKTVVNKEYHVNPRAYNCA